MDSSHAASFVQVRHAPFGQFRSLLLESLAPCPSNPAPIRVYLFLLLLFPFPTSSTPLRLRNVTAAIDRVQLLQHGSTVVTLVGHHFLDAGQVDLRLFCRRLCRF